METQSRNDATFPPPRRERFGWWSGPELRAARDELWRLLTTIPDDELDRLAVAGGRPVLEGYLQEVEVELLLRRLEVTLRAPVRMEESVN